MPVVSAAEFIDKDLFTAKGKKIDIWDSPNVQTGKVLKTIAGGQRIGKVYTWIYGTDKAGKRDGTVWFQLYESYGKANGFGAYILPKEGQLDYKAFQEQGGKSEQQKQEEKDEEDKSTFEKIWEDIKKGAGKALPYVLIFFVAKEAIKSKSGSKKEKE